MSPILKPTAKPTWRGVIHHYAGFLAVGPMAYLVLTADSSLARAAALIFAVGAVGTFAISGTYHRFNWRPAAQQRWRKVDHAWVFVAIASGWTPVLLVDKSRWILAVVWAGALTGALLTVLAVHAESAELALYPALGGGPVPTLVTVRTMIGNSAVILILVALAVYALGAIGFRTRRPDPWPSVWGYHESAHLAYTAAFALEAIAIARWVLPRL